MPTLSLVHISDLHFGQRVTGGKSAFNGFCTHDVWRIEALMIAMRQIEILVKGKGDHFACIATGDLVTVGDDASFAIAHTYLRSTFWPTRNPADNLGLVQGDELMSVPGNHDYWPGKRMVGGTRPVGHFDDTPWTRKYSVGQHKVVVVGIDTNSGVNPTGTSRVLARGAVSTGELNALDRTLATLRQNTPDVHIIAAMHHSPSLQKAKIVPSLFHAEVIEASARTDLLDVLHRRGVELIISGHVHEANTSTVRSPNYTGTPIVEARAGTATQGSGWLSRKIRPAQANSFLVHRFSQHPTGKLYYSCELFALTGRGFAYQRQLISLLMP